MKAIERYIWMLMPSLVLASLVCRGAMGGTEEEEDEALRAARIAHVSGPVMMERSQDDEWVEAVVNTPLLAGDKVYSGDNARTEVGLGDEMVVRLASDSYLELASLDDDAVRLIIPAGDVQVRVRRVDYERAPLEIESALFSAVIRDSARLRIRVEEDGSANLHVRRGVVEIRSRDSDVTEQVGRDRGILIPGENSEALTTYELRPEDDFDRWCNRRDAATAASASRRRISSRVTGYRDLDRHGDWVEVEEYDVVWRPRVVTENWAPYRHGRWVWRRRCGWVWLSSEPWGWVPYHYGRWVYTRRHQWCWVPVEALHVAHRPIWAPALVAFTYADSGASFRFSIGVGFGFGFGDGPCVGWFALGPGDPFRPWHRRRHGRHARPRHRPAGSHARRAAVEYVYRNQHAPHAVTVVSQRHFRDGHYVAVRNTTLARTGSHGVRIGNAALDQLPVGDEGHGADRPRVPRHETAPTRTSREHMERARRESRKLARHAEPVAEVAVSRRETKPRRHADEPENRPQTAARANGANRRSSARASESREQGGDAVRNQARAEKRERSPRQQVPRVSGDRPVTAEQSRAGRQREARPSVSSTAAAPAVARVARAEKPSRRPARAREERPAAQRRPAAARAAAVERPSTPARRPPKQARRSRETTVCAAPRSSGSGTTATRSSGRSVSKPAAPRERAPSRVAAAPAGPSRRSRSVSAAPETRIAETSSEDEREARGKRRSRRR